MLVSTLHMILLEDIANPYILDNAAYSLDVKS